MPSQTAQIRAEHLAWKRRRVVRIDRLCAFTSHCAALAQQPDDWYSRHVIWALGRLVQLGYEFPECDDATAAFRDLNVLAAA